MKKQIVNVSVIQSAKCLAVLYMLISLPVLAIMAVLGAISGNIGSAIAMLVIGPLVYGVVTFPCTGLLAWLYKLAARQVGGLEFSTEEMSSTSAKA